MIAHEGHRDFLHNGHLQHVHGTHIDDHRIDESDENPSLCTPAALSFRAALRPRPTTRSAMTTA